MLRQSIASLTRASLRTALQPGTSGAVFAASSSRLPSQLRNYSEQAATAESTPGSEGAEAASSAQPEQEVESVQASKQGEAGKAKDAAAAGKAAPAANDASAKQIEQLQKESKDLKDRLLRSVADFENLQKITVREKKQAKDYAIEGFAKEIIANMDILHLALNSVPEDRRQQQVKVGSSEGEEAKDALTDLYQGVALTAKGLEKTLGRFNVTSYDPTGEKFDPNLHEAMYQAPVPGKTPGSVLDCQKKGWKLKDRVLRAAQVGIVMDQ